MAETMKLAVPTMGEGGLQSERSGHFGHCDCFTLIDIVDGEIGEVSIIQNPPHEEGGCLRPVGLLSDAGADAIVAAGMGMRPMMGFANAGIDVLFDNVTPNVGDVAKLAAEGKLPHMTANEACHHYGAAKRPWAHRKAPASPGFPGKAGASRLVADWLWRLA